MFTIPNGCKLFFPQENVRAVRHSKMQSGLRGLLDVHALKVQRTFSRNRNFTDFSLPGCKIEQSCFLRSKYYSEVYGEFFGSLLPLEPTSMTTVEHRRDKDMVPILVEIVIKKLTIKPKKLTNLGRGNQLTGDEVALSTTSHPNFFRPCYIYSSSDWSRARLFAKVID